MYVCAHACGSLPRHSGTATSALRAGPLRSISALRWREALALAARPPPPRAEPQLHPGASRAPDRPRRAPRVRAFPLPAARRLLPPAALGPSAERARLAVRSPSPALRPQGPLGAALDPEAAEAPDSDLAWQGTRAADAAVGPSSRRITAPARPARPGLARRGTGVTAVRSGAGLWLPGTVPRSSRCRRVWWLPGSCWGKARSPNEDLTRLVNQGACGGAGVWPGSGSGAPPPPALPATEQLPSAAAAPSAGQRLSVLRGRGRGRSAACCTERRGSRCLIPSPKGRSTLGSRSGRCPHSLSPLLQT